MAEKNEISKDLTPQNSSVDSAPSNDRQRCLPKRLRQLFSEKKVTDTQLHEYCLIALRQCLEHGDVYTGQRLLEMLGDRYQTKRIIASWFCTFGKFKISAGRLTYRKRSDINKENLSEYLERANATPFYSNNLETIKITRLITSPPLRKKTKIRPEYRGDKSTSVWTISGGLPSLGRRR